MEYYSAIKKNEFMKFLAKWMELEGIILSEVTHSQRNSHNTSGRLHHPTLINGQIMEVETKQRHSKKNTN